MTANRTRADKARDMQVTDWMHDGRCSSEDGKYNSLFFVDDETHYVEARKLCEGCPVQDVCLDWAIITNQEHGMWGGMSPRQRRTYKKRSRAAARKERVAV